MVVSQVNFVTCDGRGLQAAAYHWAEDDDGGPSSDRAIFVICTEEGGGPVSSSDSVAAVGYQLVSDANLSWHGDLVVRRNVYKAKSAARAKYRKQVQACLASIC